MTKEREALKLALEALETCYSSETSMYRNFDKAKTDNAITAIKEALAQPEKDIPKIGCVNHDCDKCKAQPEQEPVAWYHPEDYKTHFTTVPSPDMIENGYWQPLYKKGSL